MRLTSPTDVRGLLAERGLAPSKSMGQNFLIDANTRDRIVDAAEVSAGDRVLEIGPGLGVLTEELLARGVDLTAVEKDRGLAEWLREHFAGKQRLRLIEGDALEEDLGAVDAPVWVSNLPYSVGSRIMVDAVQGAHAPERLVVMVQRDVADRAMAQVGGKEYGLFSVVLQAHCTVERVLHVGGRCFVPEPRVGSTVICLKRRADAPVWDQPGAFSKVLNRVFAHRRKQLGTILRKEFGWDEARVAEALAEVGVSPDLRPEKVEPAAWVVLGQRLIQA